MMGWASGARQNRTDASLPVRAGQGINSDQDGDTRGSKNKAGNPPATTRTGSAKAAPAE
jgi:hypothetical protein